MDAEAAGENHSASPATGTKDEPTQQPVRSALVEEAARVAATLNDKLPTLLQDKSASGNRQTAPERERESPAAREEELSSGARAPQSPGHEESGAEAAELAASPPSSQAETRGRIGRRAVTVGASVGQNLRPRVERLREASTVVFDEATDDPGLRFVIIAAVLFLLFLFIFLFSYILG